MRNPEAGTLGSSGRSASTPPPAKGPWFNRPRAGPAPGLVVTPIRCPKTRADLSHVAQQAADAEVPQLAVSDFCYPLAAKPGGSAARSACGTQLSRAPLSDSAVDFFSVADLHNIDEMSRIVDRVHDSVATLPKAVPVALSSELLTPTRARLRC